jgi:hypothetical protein
MTDLFKNRTVGRIGSETNPEQPFMRSKQDDHDRFSTDAPLPGARKYPMDVVSVERPRRGHDI